MVTSRISNLPSIAVSVPSTEYNAYSLETLRLPKISDVVKRENIKEGFISLPVCCKKAFLWLGKTSLISKQRAIILSFTSVMEKTY
jgi:hypothetical protein